MVTNNDILRRIRYALDISNPVMRRIFGLANREINQSELTNLLKKEDEADYHECSPELLEQFLNGLILFKRGYQEHKTGRTAGIETVLTNNIILKKLRIALELKEDDMIAIMKRAGFSLSKSELSALFRDSGHKNYKGCGDQFLRNFLKGLTIRNRAVTFPES